MDLFAEVFVFASIIYAVIGFSFYILFIIYGIHYVDPGAKDSTIYFKLFILPGLILFWPLFAMRWIIRVNPPPVEKNAHREAAKTYHKHTHNKA